MTAALWILGVSTICLPATAPAARQADDAAVEFYEKRIRPILAANCYECHGDDQQESNLQVTSIAAMLRGGDQGPALVPGDPDASLLMQGVRWEDDNFQMPPKAKLSGDQIAALEKWIRDGALGPDERRADAMAKKFDLAERAKHWCWQPVADPAPPEVRDAAWCREPLDRFVLAKLEAADLHPAAESDPRTLIRRVYYDLVGLPPSVAEVEEFVSEHSESPSLQVSQSASKDSETGRLGDWEKQYNALVDRLLASPRFGERWARHWLDLVRYAETRGHEFDMLIPNAYQYRDYIIRALNADVPYDRFVVEHIAGDLLSEPRLNPTTGANESILGTGFWWLGEEVHSPVDIRQDETDRVDNKVDVFSKTFLGLTLACARCHDHKFDALPTKDYYALSGFVLSMSYRQAAFEADVHNRRIYDEVKRLEAAHRNSLLAAQYDLWRPMLEQTDDYLLAVRDVLQALHKEGKQVRRAAVITATANRYELDETRLTAWVDHGERTKSDDDDPLGCWTRYAEQGVEAFYPIGPPRVPDLRPYLTGKRDEAPVPLTGIEADHFLRDGLCFLDDAAPHFRLGDSAARPISRAAGYAGLHYDPTWDVVRPAADNEQEQNRLNWQQTGRTVKSPTFTLGTGKLWYYVRGSCRVYAEVDSHRTNRGPLQGEFVKQFVGPDRWRWVGHDLSAYAGQRVHIEFSPCDPGELKENQSPELVVGYVVDCDEEPKSQLHTLLDVFRPTRDALRDIEPEAFAAWFGRLIDRAAQELDADRSQEYQSDRTADWMLRHPELWSTPSNEVAVRLEPFFARRAELLAELRRTSHTAPCAWEGSGVNEHVLVRGQHKSPGEAAPRKFLTALDGPTPPTYRTASGRLELAERVVDPSNPLTARVFVNRVWHHLLGRGIVRTVDNFGSMGDAPTHPELLDHLAREFVRDGWNVKRLIRRIVSSSTYRMSSNHLAAGLVPARDVHNARGRAPRLNAEVVDPKNDLFHRANVKRLDAEVIRDALLAVSGRLNNRMYGPGVAIYLSSFMEGRGRPGRSGPLDGDGRRSIYLGVRRNFLNPMFQAFDYPTPFTTIGRRATSNVPAQALSLLNGELVNQLASHWATRILDEVPSDADARIDRLYREALSRPPTDDERLAAREFLREQQTSYAAADANDPRVWTDLCHVLFNVKEFIYIP